MYRQVTINFSFLIYLRSQFSSIQINVRTNVQQMLSMS